MSKKHRPQKRAKPAPVIPPVNPRADQDAIQPVDPPADQDVIHLVNPRADQDAIPPVDPPADQDVIHLVSPPADQQELQPVSQPAASHEIRPDIRGVLIQLVGTRLLLPNATIAEVLSYAPPEPVEAAPEWLLGKIRWRGWQLPLVAFAELAGFGKEPAGLGSKVVVLKALGGNAKAPYFAILTQGFPRLVTVSQEGLLPDVESAELPLGMQARVLLNENAAFVPDLEAVEALINDALAQAA